LPLIAATPESVSIQSCITIELQIIVKPILTGTSTLEMASTGDSRLNRDLGQVISTHLYKGRNLNKGDVIDYGWVLDNGIWVPWALSLTGVDATDEEILEYLAQRLRIGHETVELTRKDGVLTILLWFEMNDDACGYRTTGESRIVQPV
jgi:hypothetical protein